MYTLLVDQQFGYVLITARLCRDQYWVLWGDHYSVYTLEGVTAMQRRLHAGLCHAFLVNCKIISSSVFEIFMYDSDGLRM